MDGRRSAAAHDCSFRAERACLGRARYRVGGLVVGDRRAADVVVQPGVVRRCRCLCAHRHSALHPDRRRAGAQRSIEQVDRYRGSDARLAALGPWHLHCARLRVFLLYFRLRCRRRRGSGPHHVQALGAARLSAGLCLRAGRLRLVHRNPDPAVDFLHHHRTGAWNFRLHAVHRGRGTGRHDHGLDHDHEYRSQSHSRVRKQRRSFLLPPLATHDLGRPLRAGNSDHHLGRHLFRRVHAHRSRRRRGGDHYHDRLVARHADARRFSQDARNPQPK